MAYSCPVTWHWNTHHAFLLTLNYGEMKRGVADDSDKVESKEKIEFEHFHCSINTPFK